MLPFYTRDVPTGYVLTSDGIWLVQRPNTAARWGFYLEDEHQSWDGGIGVATEWALKPRAEVPMDVRKRLGWLLADDAAAQHWYPAGWKSADPASKVREGDIIHNPIPNADPGKADALRRLCDDIDAALAARGLRIDYPACCIGFVIPIEEV